MNSHSKLMVQIVVTVLCAIGTLGAIISVAFGIAYAPPRPLAPPELTVYLAQKAACEKAGGKIEMRTNARQTVRWAVCVVDGLDLSF